MKLLGVGLLLVGMVCFAFVVTGLFAWTTDTPADATPASLADIIQLKMVLWAGLGLFCSAGGIFALFRGFGSSSNPEK